MGSLLFKTAIKWSLVAFGFQLLTSIPMLLTGESGSVISIILAALSYLVFIAVYIIAALEYSKKRNHLANTGEIIGLAALIFGITVVTGLVWGFIFQKYFYEVPPEMAAYEEQLTGMSALQVTISVFVSFIAATVGLQIAGVWRIFQKAGKEGWEAIIPIYNACVASEVGKNPAWWGILLLIPLVNIIFMIMIIHGVAKAFGKDVGWTIGLILLGFIFWPMLAWGGAKYMHGDFETPIIPPSVEDHLVD